MAYAIDNFVQHEGKQAEEIFRLPFVENPTLNEQGIKVMSGIASKLWLYYTNKLAKITKKRTGCGLPSATGDGVSVTRELLTVTDMQIYLPQCADKFNSTIWEFAKKKGVEINDLEDTDIDQFITEIIIEAAKEDYFIQMWFGDSSLVSDAFYGVYDGFFVQIATGVAANDIANYTIAAMATANDAYTALLNVYNNQTRDMKKQPKASKQFLVTRNIYDLYEAYLSNLSIGIESTYVNLTDGMEVPTFKGIPVIPVDLWDEVFEADFPGDYNNGRIVMTVDEESLIVGLDAQDDETKVKSWYSDDDDIQKYLVRYKVGTKIKFNEMLSVAGFEAAS